MIVIIIVVVVFCTIWKVEIRQIEVNTSGQSLMSTHKQVSLPDGETKKCVQVKVRRMLERYVFSNSPVWIYELFSDIVQIVPECVETI